LLARKISWRAAVDFARLPFRQDGGAVRKWHDAGIARRDEWLGIHFGVSIHVNALHALRVEPAPLSNPQPALRDYVAKAVRRYLLDLGECDSHELYDIVLREIEVPMLAEVMRHCEGNQSRAAATLGLNRATLPKKLKAYGLS
jgi:Fis family transcriptional regulator